MGQGLGPAVTTPRLRSRAIQNPIVGVETAADPFTSLLLAFYEQAAPRYDDWAGGVHRKAAARLAQLAAVKPGELVVDAGCGTGLFVRAVTSDGGRAARVLGVDVSQPMLDIAEAGCTNDPTVTFGRGIVEDLVLRDNQVDVVALGLVLSDVADPEAVLLEARRVLRPGGRVVVSEFRRSLQTEVDAMFFTELRELALLFRIPERPASHRLLGEPHVMRGLLEEAGFGDVRTSSMVVGNHTEDARAFVELMRDEGPWTHTMVGLLGPVARERLERRLTGTVRFSEEGGPFLYHRPFTFAVATRL